MDTVVVFILCALQDEAGCACAVLPDKASWRRHDIGQDVVFLGYFITLFLQVSSVVTLKRTLL